MSAAATANARILLRMLSSRGKGRYFARALGVDFTTLEAGRSGVTAVGALEGIVYRRSNDWLSYQGFRPKFCDI
jgi:hypothetical protein